VPVALREESFVSYTVRFRGIVVGRSELEQVDEPTRTLRGAFRPGMGYELLQPIFQLYAEAMRESGKQGSGRAGSAADVEKLARYHKARETVMLELHDARGRVVPAASIHIDDFQAQHGAGAIALEVRIDDTSFWSSRRLPPEPRAETS
jgi:hypothetical protein